MDGLRLHVFWRMGHPLPGESKVGPSAAFDVMHIRRVQAGWELCMAATVAFVSAGRSASKLPGSRDFRAAHFCSRDAAEPFSWARYPYIYFSPACKSDQVTLGVTVKSNLINSHFAFPLMTLYTNMPEIHWIIRIQASVSCGLRAACCGLYKVDRIGRMLCAAAFETYGRGARLNAELMK